MDFLTPSGAWALTGAAAIIVLYMLKRRYVERVVPSTYLWRQAMADRSANRPIQRVKRSLLLFMQLLMAVLLALALMHPATGGLSGGDYVFIFDISASMGAGDRMEQARRQALGWLDTMPEGSSVTVIASGDTVETLLSRTTDLTRARQTVQGIRAGYTSTDIEQAVSLGRAMAQEIEGLQIVVFSDHYQAQQDIRAVNAPAGLENRAILSVNLAEKTDRTDAVVRVANYGADAQVALEIYAEDTLWDVYTLDLAAGETGSASVALPVGTRMARVRIVQADALLADNEMTGLLQNTQTHSVAYAGQGNVFLETALALREDISLVRTDAQDIADTGAELFVQDADGLTVFALKGESSITAGSVKTAEGSLTTSNDAMMDHVDLTDIALKDYRPLSGGTALARVGQDVLIAADENSVVLGFDVHDSNLPLKADFPVLVQNILSALLPELNAQVNDALCGDIVDIRTSTHAESAWIVSPDGRQMDMPCRVETPGVYGLVQRMEDGSQIQTPFMVRIPAGESDVSQVMPSTEGENLNVTRMAGRDWALLLVGLVLLISILEWWVSRRGH